MRRIDLVVPVLLFALLALSAIVVQSAVADDPAGTAKVKTDKTAKVDFTRQWTDLLARHERMVKLADELTARLQSADINGRRKIENDLDKLRIEFESEIQPQMAKIAPVVFEKDQNDAVAAQVVIVAAVRAQKYADVVAILRRLIASGTAKPNIVEQIIGTLLQENRFTDVMAVTDPLVKAKDVNPHLLTIDSMAHYFANDFETAKELAERAAQVDPAATSGLDSFLKNCDDYAQYWTKEQEIRAREAKADDLPRVLFKTNKGDVVLELFENEAPNTVANFISLVEAKKYDGTRFHRVIPNFMAQAGDPTSVGGDIKSAGGGGPGYAIACECYTDKARKHFQGSLSMAHAGKDTGGSQFFLTHVPTPHLNWAPDKQEANHTVFGRIIKGLDVALALRIGDTIESAKVIRKRNHPYVPKKLADRAAGGKGL